MTPIELLRKLMGYGPEVTDVDVVILTFDRLCKAEAGINYFSNVDTKTKEVENEE